MKDTNTTLKVLICSGHVTVGMESHGLQYDGDAECIEIGDKIIIRSKESNQSNFGNGGGNQTINLSGCRVGGNLTIVQSTEPLVFESGRVCLFDKTLPLDRATMFCRIECDGEAKVQNTKGVHLNNEDLTISLSGRSSVTIGEQDPGRIHLGRFHAKLSGTAHLVLYAVVDRVSMQTGGTSVIEGFTFLKEGTFSASGISHITGRCPVTNCDVTRNCSGLSSININREPIQYL